VLGVVQREVGVLGVVDAARAQVRCVVVRAPTAQQSTLTDLP